jgi:hypothetical protein
MAVIDHPHDGCLFGTRLSACILSTLASIPAERLLRPHRSAFVFILTHCKTDWGYAEELCKHNGLDIEEYLREAGRIVRRLAPSIYRVAKELEEKKGLSYEDVSKLCPEAVVEGKAVVQAYFAELGIDPLDRESATVQTCS